QGVNVARSLPKLRKVILAFDADKDKPGSQVGQELAQLCVELKKLGLTVVVEDWKPEDGKGIDNIILNGAENRITIIEGETLEAWIHERLSIGFADNWARISKLKLFVNLDNLLERKDREQFNFDFGAAAKAARKHGEPEKIASESEIFPRYESFTYEPGNTERDVERDGMKYLNLWRPGILVPKPCTEDEIRQYLDLAAYIYPDDYRRLLDLFAWVVQHPGRKTMWATLLITTDEAVGKRSLI